MKNIVVVGGGTAGWFTALMAKKYYEFTNVILIESSEIGILGAGEGTTPHFIDLLNQIDIKLEDVIREADATLKNGIRFINWNGNGSDYFHSFVPNIEYNSLENFSVLMAQINRYKRLDNINLADKLSNNNKVPFYSTDGNTNALDNLQNISKYGIHFNARKFAAFLSKTGIKRGIKKIDGKVVEIRNDELGNITGLRLEGSSNFINTDFVFDCSGFARLIIGKHFKSPWISYSDHLPMKRALPFFIEHDNNVAPETRSIAMSTGWAWQIPVQGRYGCGYVFDSDYISDDQALAEAESVFGRKLEVPKTFSFSAGTQQHALINNCLAVGLSQGFVEPLEATSIWIAYINLHDFITSNGIFVRNAVFEDTYNRRCLRRNNYVKDFIYLHYLTQRKDSKFWQEFRTKNPMIDSVAQTLSLISEYPFINLDNNLFNNLSWLQVGHGLGAIQLDNYYKIYKFCNNDYCNQLRDQAEHMQNSVIKDCFDHKEFFESLM